MASRFGLNFTPYRGESAAGKFSTKVLSIAEQMKNTRAQNERLNLLKQNSLLAQNRDVRAQELHESTMGEKQRVLDQRTAMTDLGNMADPINAPLTGAVNTEYDLLNKKYAGQDLVNDPVAKESFNKELAALNQGLYKDLGDGQTIDNTRANYALNRDPLAFKKQALAKLMSTGNFTKAEALSAVNTELDTRYPVASKEAIEANRKMNETIFKEHMGILKKGIKGGASTVFNPDGTVTVTGGGSGANKTVSTQKDNPTLISNTIENLAINKDLTGKLSGVLFGEDRPTKDNLNKTVTLLKAEGYDDTQIARGLEAGVSENWLTDDTLASPKRIAQYMGVPAASSVRTTNKGGGSGGTGGGVASNAELRRQMAALTQNYQANNQRITQSGLRGRADKSSLADFFNLNTSAEPKKQTKKPKTNSTNKKNITTKTEEPKPTVTTEEDLSTIDKITKDITETKDSKSFKELFKNSESNKLGSEITKKPKRGSKLEEAIREFDEQAAIKKHNKKVAKLEAQKEQQEFGQQLKSHVNPTGSGGQDPFNLKEAKAQIDTVVKYLASGSREKPLFPRLEKSNSVKGKIRGKKITDISKMGKVEQAKFVNQLNKREIAILVNAIKNEG